LLTAPDLAQALSWYELAYRYGNDEATDDIDRVKTAMSRPAFHTKKSFF
jgi:TPR repeat protein